jgi:hypothetical protein
MSKTLKIVTFLNSCKKRTKKQFSTKKSTAYRVKFVLILVADVLQGGRHRFDEVSLADGGGHGVGQWGSLHGLELALVKDYAGRIQTDILTG